MEILDNKKISFNESCGQTSFNESCGQTKFHERASERQASSSERSTCVAERRAQRKENLFQKVCAFCRYVRPFLTGVYQPRTWSFWRTIIVCFCICCIVGHWLEMPYCSFMNLFGIVEADYAVWTDPWYHPYWVYGFGSVGLILGIEPLKERIIKRRKTLWGAFLETLLIAILLSMCMELIFGWIVNQPDPITGEYPYWDNSQLPLNVFGQAWLVNDFFIGLAGMLVVWVIFPLLCAMFSLFTSRVANRVFIGIVVAFALCCFCSYMELALWTK